MAFIDTALRHRFTSDPNALIGALRSASVRIGVPQHACVTGTIQGVRQETREVERRRNPELPPYRGTIAMRELVHSLGSLRIAYEQDTLADELSELLAAIAPAINYFGKRGSFVQYASQSHVAALDDTFTCALETDPAAAKSWGHRATLDDFGPKASFDALNSFSGSRIEPGVHRSFVETFIPLREYNAGPGFTHFVAPGAV